MKPLSTEALVKKYKTLSDDQKIEISKLLKNGKIGTPKKSRLDKNLTHKVIGSLVFEYSSQMGNTKPIHNMEVELWDRDITNPDDFLGSSQTKLDGSFTIYYDPKDAGKGDLPDLELRIFEHQHKFDKGGNIRDKKKLVFSIRGEDNVTREIYDFGVCGVPYWEYDPDAGTPRVLITDEGDAPQSYGPGRSLVMVKVLAAVELKKRRHLLKKNSISIANIQKDYEENTTLQMERNSPGSSRSDEYFTECLLNGMSSSILDRDPRNKDLYWIHYHWNSYEQDGKYALPNVDIKFQKSDGKLKPVEITVAERTPGETKAGASITSKTKSTPDDGEKWMQAKRIARVSSSLVAELDMHLCTTHLNLEQYAIPAYRNIRKNPIRYLLFPHIKEVSLINNSANQLLLGKTGSVTRSAGLTEESLNKRIEQNLGTLDWKNWEPRNKICDSHTYADAAHLYWEVLIEYVEWFFERYKKDIKENWIEILRFSDELVENSNAVFMCNYLGQELDPEYVAKNIDTISERHKGWYEWNERMDISVPRPIVNGVQKAVSRITETDDPEDQDMKNIKQVCTYVIHHATFMHWWSNSRQYAEGGELRFTGLGLRYGNNGIWTDEADDSVLPPPEDATKQLWICYMLSKTGFGFILKNEEKDIHPKFLQLLRDRQKDFEKLNINIEEIPSRTNI